MGGPYQPETAIVGGIPSASIDIPITAVFLLLFVIGAASHMTILQLNRRKGHKFMISSLMFSFCMARIVSCVMRIVWATRHNNVNVVIAAEIFLNAGTVLLFIINILFAQRIVRAAHPNFGWHKTFHRIFATIYWLILLMFTGIITVTIQSFFVKSPDIHRIDRDIQITVSSYYIFITFLPIAVVLIGIVVPSRTRIEKFGTGHFRAKIFILLTSAFLLCLGATFRAATTFKNPRPVTNPAWYDDKGCFYFFNFTIEILVIYLYLLVRVDHRFWIPNGSRMPGDFSKAQGTADGGQLEPRMSRESGTVSPLLSEEEVFDDSRPSCQTLTEAEKDLEASAVS